MRRAVLVGAVAAIAMAITGCSMIPSSYLARVPTTGPITQGEQVTAQTEDQVIRVIARPPRPGMTPRQVVQGFLDASASFDDDHAVARQYLTPKAALGWDTNAGVEVYQGALALTDQGPAVAVTGELTGTIGASGRYTIATPGSTLAHTFTLAKVQGEWRLDNVPPGLVLSQSDIDRGYRSYDVYFFNPSFGALVPDPRLIPVNLSGLATALVRRLVAGPSEWLQPAVRTAFPEGVRLNIDSVPVDNGVAHVDLTTNALTADDTTRTAMSQQLIWTLRQLPEIRAVDVTAAGQPFLVPGLANPEPRTAWPDMDPAGMPPGTVALAARPSGVVALRDSGVESVQGAAGTDQVPFVQLAVAPDGQSLAGISEDGAVWRGRLTAGAPLIRLRPPATPTGISFGPGGTVWVTDGTVLSVASDGGQQAVTVSGLPRRARLVKVIPSSDGTRALVLYRRAGHETLVLARVVRGSGAATPIRVDQPVLVSAGLVDVTDASWSAPDTVAVLGSLSAGTTQVISVSLANGATQPLGTPGQATEVAAASGQPILVASGDGLVYEQSLGTWRERARAVAPAYPG